MGDYKDKHGKTRIGDFLQRVAPNIAKTVGNILPETGVLGVVRNIISNDSEMTGKDKEEAFRILELDFNEAKMMEENITKRWDSDSKSDSWLSKNVRPLVLINYTFLVDAVVISSMVGKPLSEIYLPLVLTMATTVTSGYFVLREFGKTKKK